MEKTQATDYLNNLINKTLRITTTDARTFIGTFKCTDSDCNIILARSHEYRRPTSSAIAAALSSSCSSSSSSTTNTEEKQGTTVKVDMTSRFVGLIVVPGEHICKIEVEEFASQSKGRTLPGT